MKVRYVITNGYGMGGTIRTIVNQANGMARAGHDVELVSVVRKRMEPYFSLDPRVRMTTLVDYTLPPRPPRRWNVPERRATKRRQELSAQPGQIVPRDEARSATFTEYVEWRVADYLSSLRDGILVTSRPALNILAAKFATSGTVRVAQEHMNLGTHRAGVHEEILRCYPQLDALVVLTRRDQQDYAAQLPGAAIFRIPNAIHSLDQEPSEHTNKIISAAGRLTPQKGFDRLIPAFARVVDAVPDWQLRIYGDGRETKRLRRLINEHHLYNHVLLMGRTDQLDRELAKSSMYVLSSRFEGLPMVMIEAMSHSLPVVSFDCPTGPGDVLSHNIDGILVPPGDVEGLADAMQALVADVGTRRKMGTAARETATMYGPDAVTPQWEELFADLVRTRRG